MGGREKPSSRQQFDEDRHLHHSTTNPLTCTGSVIWSSGLTRNYASVHEMFVLGEDGPPSLEYFLFSSSFRRSTLLDLSTKLADLIPADDAELGSEDRVAREPRSWLNEREVGFDE